MQPVFYQPLCPFLLLDVDAYLRLLFIRPENICELISSGYAISSMTKPANALISVCEVLNLNRLSVLSPHYKKVSKSLRLTLDECGLKLGFLEYLMKIVRDMLHAYLLDRL